MFLKAIIRGFYVNSDILSVLSSRYICPSPFSIDEPLMDLPDMPQVISAIFSLRYRQRTCLRFGNAQGNLNRIQKDVVSGSYLVNAGITLPNPHGWG